MPIDSSMSKAERFHEVRHGKEYKRVRAKFGEKKARKQMIARALNPPKKKRGGKKRKSSRR